MTVNANDLSLNPTPLNVPAAPTIATLSPASAVQTAPISTPTPPAAPILVPTGIAGGAIPYTVPPLPRIVVGQPQPSTVAYVPDASLNNPVPISPVLSTTDLIPPAEPALNPGGPQTVSTLASK